MKRPFAVIGFSMLTTFLIITNITHKMTIALLTGAVVIFTFMLIFKSLRKYLSVIFALSGVVIFTISFICAEKYYLGEMKKFEKEQTMTGVVCQIPTESDYAFSYIIKPDGKNYKIRYVTEENVFLCEGDYVKMSLINNQNIEETDILENSLSSKVYFTFFKNDECTIEKTGGTNLYYRNVSVVKREFSEIIMNYMPGQNGVLAKAMTIGDNSEIDDITISYFNYSGTSHLLVISGLHLTLWSIGIMKYLNKFSRTRKYSTLIGFLCLFAYSSITGFSVSVIRAGAMVVAVLISRLFRRDADSINSIGVAVTFILMENPFAPKSVSLWLTVLSTLGIIAYSGKLQSWIEEKFRNKLISRLPFYSALVTNVAISFSVSVFTLPVFIYILKMMPIASVVSNFIMVSPAMVMMIMTVSGVACHIFHLYPFSRICFFVTGAIGELMHFTAEKIGMAEWSTISLNHRYYKYFLVVLLIGIIVVFVLKKYNIDILKHISMILSVIFCLVALYCTVNEYNTPSVELFFTSSAPIITVCSEGESILVGLQDKKYIRTIREMLNAHNEKELDNIVVTENDDTTVSELICLYSNFRKSDTYFPDEAPWLFRENSTSFATDFSVSENVNIDINDLDSIKINIKDKNILVVNCKKTENIYEKAKIYDIIILYNDNSGEIEKLLRDKLSHSMIIGSKEGRKASVYI